MLDDNDWDDDASNNDALDNEALNETLNTKRSKPWAMPMLTAKAMTSNLRFRKLQKIAP